MITINQMDAIFEIWSLFLSAYWQFNKLNKNTRLKCVLSQLATRNCH